MIGGDERVQVSIREHGVDVARLAPRAQVLDHLIRVENVAADLVAKPDVVLGTTQLIECLGTLLELQLVELRAQDAHARRLVLDLASLVLAGDDDARGDVRDAHGRVGRVDALAAGAACMVDVDADVSGVNLDLDVIGQNRQHLDACEGRLAALLGVRGRDANETVNALLGTEHAIGVLAAHRERGTVDANDLGRRRVVHRHLPAATLAVAQVHVQKHAAPVLRLEPALARRDAHDGITLVKLAGKPARKLQLAQVVLERVCRCLGLGKEVVIVHLGRKLKSGLRVIKLGMGRLDARNVVLRLGETRHGLPRSVRVVPKAGLGAALLKVSNKGAALVNVQIPLDLGKPLRERVEALLVHVSHYRFLPWQFLNFLPLPQGQGSLRPTPT